MATPNIRALTDPYGINKPYTPIATRLQNVYAAAKPAPAPAPKPKPRVTTTNTQVQQTQAPAPSGDVGVSAPSFDEAAYQAEQERLLNEQIEASYAPAYENLNSVEAQYRQEYPTSQKMIEQGFAEAVPQLESERSAKLSSVDTQRKRGKTEEKDQFAKARQKYNELRAGLLTRFGGASSTGEATQELLGRATSQEMAGIEENFGTLYGSLDAEEKNVNNFYNDKKANLEQQKSLKLEQLKNQFDATIRDINSKRFLLDSEKAAKRLASLQAFSAQARQIQYEAQKFQQQIDLWKSAKDETLALAKQFQAKSFTMPGIPGILGGFSVSGIGGSGGGTSPTGVLSEEQLAAMRLQPYSYDSTTGKVIYRTDPYANLFGGSTGTGTNLFDDEKIKAALEGY